MLTFSHDQTRPQTRQRGQDGGRPTPSGCDGVRGSDRLSRNTDAERADAPRLSAVLGPRARETRRRLLEAVASSVASTPYRDVRVQDVARHAGTSAATFYNYFSDLESAILVLSEDLYRQVLDLAPRALTPPSAFPDQTLLIDLPAEILAFCAENSVLMRLTNLCADEGREPFIEMRTAIWKALTAPIAKLVEVEGGKPPGEGLVHPIVAALMEAALRVDPTSQISLMKTLGVAWLS